VKIKSLADSRRQQEQAAFARLRLKYPDVRGQIEGIERLIQLALDARIEPQRLEIVLNHFCLDQSFLEGFSDFLVQEQTSILASQANFALNAWRPLDATNYAKYGSIFAQSSNIRMGRAVAISVSYGPPLENPIPEDVMLLTLLTRRTEGYILADVLVGLKRLARVPGYDAAALELYANMRVGNDFYLAKRYCEFAGPYGIPRALLNRGQVERLLVNLMEVDELDRDALASLMRTFVESRPWRWSDSSNH
jgi:hypothetical protein